MDTCTQCGLPLSKRIFNRIQDSSREHYCCYGCYLTFQITREKGEHGKAQGILIRLGLGIFFAMNVMLFSLPTYSSFFFDLENSGLDEANFLFLLRIGLIVFSTPVLILLGLPILINSLKDVFRVSFSVDTLIAIGTFAAYSLSIYNTVRYNEHVYFDTATMLLVLVTLGRYLEARAKVRTADSLKRIINVSQKKSLVLRGNVEKEIESGSIQLGDKIRILPGHEFPVDGAVLEGTGGVDESSITGESRPVFKEVGDKVCSGTFSLDGTFIIKAEKVESESTLAKITKLLEKAKQTRAPIERTADKITTIFTPMIILIAIVTLIFWGFKIDPENGLLIALSVLVVSCPCALGIATPIAIWIAYDQAVKEGILLRNGETLESLSNLQKVFFDKTGTLTSGNLHFNRVVVHPDIKKSKRDIELTLFSLASYSSHPVAKSITHTFTSLKPSVQQVYHFKTHPGLGIEGRIGSLENSTCYFGSKLFMTISDQKIDSYSHELIAEAEAQGETVVLLASESKINAVLTFKEEWRPEAESVITHIQKLGLQTSILTGDSKPISLLLQQKFQNVEFQTGLLPEQKVKAIENNRSNGFTSAMVGDGINDAPALAASDVGVAMGTGTDLAREAANVNIISSDLGKIPWMITYARRVKRKIYENLFWAFAYNIGAIAFAASGLLNPLIAATAMIFSSLIVIWNSQQLKNK